MTARRSDRDPAARRRNVRQTHNRFQPHVDGDVPGHWTRCAAWVTTDGDGVSSKAPLDWQQPPGAGMRMSGNLLNGITSRQRRVTNDDAANPRPTLTNGHPRTSGGSGSVPGGPSL